MRLRSALEFHFPRKWASTASCVLSGRTWCQSDLEMFRELSSAWGAQTARLVWREGGIFAKGHEIGIVGDVSDDPVNSRQLGANHFQRSEKKTAFRPLAFRLFLTLWLHVYAKWQDYGANYPSPKFESFCHKRDPIDYFSEQKMKIHTQKSV